MLFFLLAGCATPRGNFVQPAAEIGRPQDFVIEGRFSLRHEDKNYSGRLHWRHQGENNDLLLSSPFGQGLARITTNARGAYLTHSDGTVTVAASIEALTQTVLGMPLPLSRLVQWIRGIPPEGVSEFDGAGRLSRLHHEAWRIQYAYDDDDPASLPRRIIAEHAGGDELRLRIESWERKAEGVIP